LQVFRVDPGPRVEEKEEEKKKKKKELKERTKSKPEKNANNLDPRSSDKIEECTSRNKISSSRDSDIKTIFGGSGLSEDTGALPGASLAGMKEGESGIENTASYELALELKWLGEICATHKMRSTS